MARPRLPTELLELRGTFKKNPQRKRAVGPKTNRPLGNPPAWFTESQAEAWKEFVENGPAGVLTSGDREIVSIVAKLMAKFRTDWLTGAEFSTLKTSLVELGRTPAARSKVAASEPEEPADEFAEFRRPK